MSSLYFCVEPLESIEDSINLSIFKATPKSAINESSLSLFEIAKETLIPLSLIYSTKSYVSVRVPISLIFKMIELV